MSEHLSLVMPVYNERYLAAEAVRRVLAVKHALIHRLDLIVVDDGSTDGTRAILRDLAAQHPDRITYIEHPKNLGKGAAVRTGVARARGTVTVIQDADLEYNPQDLPRLIVPFVEHGATAVYGSRFLTAEYRRVLYYRHRIGNSLLTTCCNLLTDLDLTDVETCYKAVRTPLLQSIPIRSRDFRLEVELTFKLAKRGARIFEVPISYSGRTYDEGKKIGFRDALLAVAAMVHWSLVDDVYTPDEYGSDFLADMAGSLQFNHWLADTLHPYVGDRVLEIGAGIGNLTRSLVPRDCYTTTDVNPHYLSYLRETADGKPYMDVRHLDLECQEEFASLSQRYSTVICVNRFASVSNERQALESMRCALQPGGRAILVVPQNPALYGSLDQMAGFRRRYTRRCLLAALEETGFLVERIVDFNRVTTPLWWINSRVLHRRHFSKMQLKAFSIMIWLLRRLDRVWPWQGVSLIAVAQRPRD